MDPKLLFDVTEWFTSLLPSKVRSRTYTVEEAVRQEVLLEDKVKVDLLGHKHQNKHNLLNENTSG